MEIITMIMQLMLSNSPFVLDAVLLGIICCLLWERVKFHNTINRQHDMIKEYRDQYAEDIKDIINKYYNSNIALVKAIDEVRVVLNTIVRTGGR